MLFAEIILPISLPQTLTYGVPEKFQKAIKRGQRVEVNLGKNKNYAGLVHRLHENRPDLYRIKPVKKILDKTPIISDTQIKFWEWVAQYYCCTLGDVMQAALPAHLKLMNDSVLIWNKAVVEIPQFLSDDGYLLAEALQIRKQLTVAEARKITEDKNHAKAITEILDYELGFIAESLKEKYKAKKEKYVGLTSIYEADEEKLSPVFDNLKNAPKQSELLLHFFQIRQTEGEVKQKVLLKKAGAGIASLKGLIKKGILETYKKEISRLISTGDNSLPKKDFKLNEEQQNAYKTILNTWMQKDVILLQGVTGSGKTMIYIRLIQEAIKKGNQVLLLLPEIALTTHFVQRLFGYFGDLLGVYHSRFSNNERVEIWKKVQNGDYKVIMGARSALWLPFQNLSQIIVDEEHETSYKQQNPAPRFQARDAAIYYATLKNAKVLLGTATPSMESAYNVQTGKYGFVALRNRYQNQSMPEVNAIAAGNIRPALSSMMTITLLDAIQETFSEGKQVLLFQNKRGYAPFMICASCGYIPHCSNCDVSMTYHKLDDRMHCHYCGRKTLPIKNCPQCGSSHVLARSFGTEKIEEELTRIFPKRNVARMDTDSVRGKNKMSQLIKNFERGSIDILVGTQMIVKGLDFEHVGLVGILSADSLWSFPNFRVNERAFQLMEQVSGRAGRTLNGRGRVFIQAFNLKHPLLAMVAHHDFKNFYRQEIKVRQKFNYPPFSKIIKITLRHQKKNKVSKAAVFLAEQLKEIENITIQGPTEGLIARIRNYYLFDILLKMPSPPQQLATKKEDMLTGIQNLKGLKGYKSIRVTINVDP